MQCKLRGTFFFVSFVLSNELCTKADENGSVILSLQMLYEGQCKYASKIRRYLREARQRPVCRVRPRIIALFFQVFWKW